jgi:hypothetical protein
MTISVGRIVYYFGLLGRPRLRADGALTDSGPFAALVIDVAGTESCTLEVTARDGTKHICVNVPHDESMLLDTWSWPLRVG